MMILKFSLAAIVVVASVSLPLSSALADGYRHKPGVVFSSTGASSGISLGFDNRGGVSYGFYYQNTGNSRFRPHHGGGYRQYRHYNSPRYGKPYGHYSGRGYHFKPPGYRAYRHYKPRHGYYRHYKPRHGYYGHLKPRRHHPYYFKPRRPHRHYGYHYYRRHR